MEARSWKLEVFAVKNKFVSISKTLVDLEDYVSATFK